METLGSRLRKARDDKRLTQTDVAKMLEVEGGTISGYERNYRDPDTTTLAKLAKIYGVSTDFLTTGKEKGKRDDKMEKANADMDRFVERVSKLPDEERELVSNMVELILKKHGL